MAELAGVRIRDASGNALTDASAAYIVDQNIAVVQDGYGYLYNGTMQAAGGGSLWGQILAWLLENLGPIVGGAIIDKLLAGSGQPSIDFYAYLPETLSQVRRLIPDTGTVAQKLDLIDEHVLAIEPGEPGGLTPEEHDQLFGLANVDPNAIGQAVWDHDLWTEDMQGVGQSLQARQVMFNFWVDALYRLGWVGVPLPDNPFFAILVYTPEQLTSSMWNWEAPGSAFTVPYLDLSTVQEGDTVLSWLTREYAAYTWHTNLPADTVGAKGIFLWDGEAPNTYAYRCLLTDADLHTPNVSVVIDPVDVTTVAAPVWPGSGSVTLGDPVALANHMVIHAAMDGVIVTVTTPPQHTGRYQIGTETYDYGVGRIAFGTDAGDLEPWQYLGFRSAVFTPKSMKRAASVHLQVLGGAEGTVTPWTVS